MNDFELLNSLIMDCERCPRLRSWCNQVAAEKRKAYQDWDYWGRPVPNFGDFSADRLIVGLAPAAHGANRTGRMFTGDRSGDWLYRALFRAGAANQPDSTNSRDGLRLDGVMITAICHCAPPDNKPTTQEIANCRVHLQRTLMLRKWRSILCLGSIAWNETLKAIQSPTKPKFGHGVHLHAHEGLVLWASYHPSQQNTFTGRLTEAMLDDVVWSFLT